MKEVAPPGAEDKIAPPLANPARTKAMKRRGQQDKRQELFRMVGSDLTAIDGDLGTFGDDRPERFVHGETPRATRW